MLNVQKVKGRMKEMNITQEQLAKRLKMNPSTLNRKINDPTGRLLSIAEAKEIKEYLAIEMPDEYFFYTGLADTQRKPRAS